MAIGQRHEPPHTKIEVEELTTEQRAKYANFANKADKKRLLKATLLKKKRQLYRNKNKTLKYTTFLIVFCILSLFTMYLFEKVI